MFELHFKSGGPVVMRDGSPFRYSTRELAEMGRKALASKVDGTLIVVPV